jgi:CBS domain-containing protein
MKDRPLAGLVRHQNPPTIPPDATVRQACALMRDSRMGCVLVTGADGGLLGILTGRDVTGRVGAEGRDASATPVSEVMTPGPACLPPDASHMDALRLMEDGGFRHVPVVAEGRPLGVVSRGDFRSAEQERLEEEAGLAERIW